MIDKINEWRPSMGWADLIFLTDNSKLGPALRPFFRAGYPIIGANEDGAKLELDREAGQGCFERFGIETLPFETFTSYDKAIDYVKKEMKPFVSKPWGGNPDKSLSYVPKSPEDLVCRLQRWKKDGVKGEFLLQEKIDGAEMAVGGWFGPGGWSKWLNENWEEKRMMAGGLGVNTGEMGTVMRYVKKSQLFNDVLKPVTEYLEEISYVGYIDVNCLVDEKGTPWPLEFTCRPGWPHFNLCMALHQGDPVAWMVDLLKGKDTLDVSEQTCVGVVMAMGDYPWDLLPPNDSEGWPIRGLSSKTLPSLALSSVMRGKAPVAKGKNIAEQETVVTAGSYVLVATGLGDSVTEAQESVYDTCHEIGWPPHQIYRNDIGDRLEEDLPKLQEHGFADGMEF